MNKYLIIPLCILAVAAIAAPVTGPNGERLGEEGWPKEIGAWKNPTREIAEAEGYHYSTAEELAAWAAQDEAAAAAEAEAAATYIRVDPTVLVPRVDGSLTNVVGTSRIFADDDGSLFATTETGSPTHTKAEQQAQKDARDAKKAARAQAKQAAKTAGNWKDFQSAVIVWMEAQP